MMKNIFFFFSSSCYRIRKKNMEYKTPTNTSCVWIFFYYPRGFIVVGGKSFECLRRDLRSLIAGKLFSSFVAFESRRVL
jgi:hypothetical protein